jgi:exonuclease III
MVNVAMCSRVLLDKLIVPQMYGSHLCSSLSNKIMDTLKIAVWNANGLCQRAQEIRLFLQTNSIDVLLVSETHVSERSHITISRNAIYHIPHPDTKAHGGTAVIIRRNLKHHPGTAYSEEHIQATSVVLEDHMGEITVTAVTSTSSKL